jgi:Uma2 family endonuclease
MKPLREKMKEYMENQVRLAWLIDRKNRKVEIYQAKSRCGSAGKSCNFVG